MSDNANKYWDLVQTGGKAAVRNLAGAEAAIGRGQFNVAKVLRAAAHTQRSLAMQAARELVKEMSAEELLQMVADEVESIEQLPGIDAQAPAVMVDIVGRSLESLESNPDVLEKVVPLIIVGCYSCGIIMEQQSEVCPNCGALGVEFEWFGPFYAETKEHLGQLRPEEIIDILKATPDQVAAVIEGMDEAILDAQPTPEEWSAKIIIAHIFETDFAFCARVRTILESDGFPPLPRDKPPWKTHEGKGYEKMTGSELLAQFREVRAETLDLVSQLSDADWVRAGTLMGSVSSILDLGTWLANHDVGHMAQVKRQVA